MPYPRVMKKARTNRRCTRKGPYSTTTKKELPCLHSTAAIKGLPRDLLVEVVTKVASHSFVDLHPIKTCYKDFLDATEDSYVLRKVSLDTFPLIHWFPNEKVSLFLNRCRECGNIESLYREGLQEYFNPHGKVDGLEILNVAAQKGHKEAKYVCGMILLCSKDDELRKQGLEHMRFLRKSMCVVSCRSKVKRLLVSMWKNNSLLERSQSPLCHFKSTCNGWRVKTCSWALPDDEDDDISLCKYCRWDHELECFYRLFNVH